MLDAMVSSMEIGGTGAHPISDRRHSGAETIEISLQTAT
jgi:hypothetical protein